MMRFLSFPSQENIFGHFLVLTRRNPSLLTNKVSEFEENSCLQLKCFLSEEAKQFIYLRTGANSEENVESIAECLCEELERLPLALEQAGAYIKMLNCDLASYLQQYKTERLRLLNRQPARPVSPGNESSHRLAVHTTWLINMEYMCKSPNGQAAVRFMNACSYFNGNKIQEELVNVGTPEVEDIVYRKCVSSPLGCRQVLKLLTDFSLFTYVKANSISTHRLVQDLIKESLRPESKAESFIDAVRMLSYAFSKCSSPSDFVNLNKDGEQQSINVFDLPKSPSHFYMWSELCMHAHNLCRNIEDLIVDNDSVCLDALWFSATARILYESAVHLSTHYKQEEAKRTLNFAYRILDWLPSAEYDTVKNHISRSCLFPLSIPSSNSIQRVIKRCCIPPFAPLQPLSDKPASVASDVVSDFAEKVEKLKINGNKHFKEYRFTEALDAYSSAINLAQDFKDVFNPLLLINRATVYIKLEQYEEALKDANDYITRRPDCWRGYTRKALALHGLGEHVSAEIAASLAFYYDRAVFSDFAPFRETFLDLPRRIFVCDSVDELQKGIYSQSVDENVSKILVLGSEEYILNSDTFVEPWNNCILVGTRENSVSLKSSNRIVLLKCMLTNLSFYFDKHGLCCIPGSFVKILKCNFTSNNEEITPVSIMGDFNAEHCNFTESSSGLVCTGEGNAVIVDCSFCNNRRQGIEVREGGTLHLKRCRLCNNSFHGLIIIKASKCSVFNCVVYENVAAGILSEDSKSVFIGCNNVFDNVFGLHIINCDVDISENNVFDNGAWGIYTQNNSKCNISINRVFRSKVGGIRVGYRAGGNSPCVVEKNKIYDNIGPGLVEDAIGYEKQLLRTNLGQSYFVSPDYFQRAKCQDNEIYNNKESKNVSKFNISVPYCSNCRKNCEPNRCGKCFTAGYCNKTCQENHWSKHKKICKVLHKKSSLLITSMKRAGYDGMIKRHAKVLQEVGPNFSPPPPRDGRKFVVKVQPMFYEDDFKSYTLLLYDRSLELYKRIQSKVLANIVQEFGVLCKRVELTKKLFLYCSFEENGQLRLFINEFSDFLNW